ANRLQQGHGKVAVQRAAIRVSLAGDVLGGEHRLALGIAYARSNAASNRISLAPHGQQVRLGGQVGQRAHEYRGRELLVSLLPGDFLRNRGAGEGAHFSLTVDAPVHGDSSCSFANPGTSAGALDGGLSRDNSVGREVEPEVRHIDAE